MYLHLGLDVMVNADNITGIFDLENTTTSRTTREYLKGAESRHEVISVVTDIPKSFVVVTNKEKKNTVYISQLSASTLTKRLRAEEDKKTR